MRTARLRFCFHCSAALRASDIEREDIVTFTMVARAAAKTLGIAGTALLFGVAGCGEAPVTMAQETTKIADYSKRAAELAEQNARIERLLVDLARAGDETERAAVHKELEAARTARNKLLGKRGVDSSIIGCSCEPGDTACSML
jgi:hypothetical protein